MELKEIEKAIIELYRDKKLTKLLEGGMSYAYEINNKIIRIPKTQYAEHGYETEYAILKYLQEAVTCTQLPDIRIVREPFFHTVHNKIFGVYWNGKEYLAKSEKQRDALAEDCAEFFTQLHASDVKNIDAELLELHPIQKNMETYLTDYFSMDEMNEILNFTNPLFSLKDKVLVHRDFYIDNFLLNNDYRLNAVLDFGNSGLYNYMFDFKALASWEESMKDFFTRIASRYTRLSGRIIDMETIRRIDIHNYISFLVYFIKNKNIKDEKIGAVNHLDEHVAHIKDKMKKYVK